MITEIGSYQLLDVLGHGAFGEVRLGMDKRTKEKVAIKLIRKDIIVDESEVKRVMGEFFILHKLEHKHVIKFFEVLQDSEKLYLVMEYAAGNNLSHYLKKQEGGRLDEKTARKFFSKIISAVRYCHRKNVIHRDLKPDNILLTSTDDIKVADFGLSNTVTSGARPRSPVGTPLYAAPEVLFGDAYPQLNESTDADMDPSATVYTDGDSTLDLRAASKYHPGASDIWSSGVMLYEMVFGVLPFKADNIRQLRAAVLDNDLFIPPEASPSLASLLKQMLCRDPLKRISAEEVCMNSWVTGASQRASLPSTMLEGVIGGMGGLLGSASDASRSRSISLSHPGGLLGGEISLSSMASGISTEAGGGSGSLFLSGILGNDTTFGSISGSMNGGSTPSPLSSEVSLSKLKPPVAGAPDAPVGSLTTLQAGIYPFKKQSSIGDGISGTSSQGVPSAGAILSNPNAPSTLTGRITRKVSLGSMSDIANIANPSVDNNTSSTPPIGISLPSGSSLVSGIGARRSSLLQPISNHGSSGLINPSVGSSTHGGLLSSAATSRLSSTQSVNSGPHLLKNVAFGGGSSAGGHSLSTADSDIVDSASNSSTGVNVHGIESGGHISTGLLPNRSLGLNLRGTGGSGLLIPGEGSSLLNPPSISHQSSGPLSGTPLNSTPVSNTPAFFPLPVTLPASLSLAPLGPGLSASPAHLSLGMGTAARTSTSDSAPLISTPTPLLATATGVGSLTSTPLLGGASPSVVSLSGAAVSPSPVNNLLLPIPVTLPLPLLLQPRSSSFTSGAPVLVPTSSFRLVSPSPVLEPLPVVDNQEVVPLEPNDTSLEAVDSSVNVEESSTDVAGVASSPTGDHESIPLPPDPSVAVMSGVVEAASGEYPLGVDLSAPNPPAVVNESDTSSSVETLASQENVTVVTSVSSSETVPSNVTLSLGTTSAGGPGTMGLGLGLGATRKMELLPKSPTEAYFSFSQPLPQGQSSNLVSTGNSGRSLGGASPTGSTSSIGSGGAAGSAINALRLARSGGLRVNEAGHTPKEILDAISSSSSVPTSLPSSTLATASHPLVEGQEIVVSDNQSENEGQEASAVEKGIPEHESESDCLSPSASVSDLSQHQHSQHGSGDLPSPLSSLGVEDEDRDALNSSSSSLASVTSVSSVSSNFAAPAAIPGALTGLGSKLGSLNQRKLGPFPLSSQPKAYAIGQDLGVSANIRLTPVHSGVIPPPLSASSSNSSSHSGSNSSISSTSSGMSIGQVRSSFPSGRLAPLLTTSSSAQLATSVVGSPTNSNPTHTVSEDPSSTVRVGAVSPPVPQPMHSSLALHSPSQPLQEKETQPPPSVTRPATLSSRIVLTPLPLPISPAPALTPSFSQGAFTHTAVQPTAPAELDQLHKDKEKNEDKQKDETSMQSLDLPHLEVQTPSDTSSTLFTHMPTPQKASEPFPVCSPNTERPVLVSPRSPPNLEISATVEGTEVSGNLEMSTSTTSSEVSTNVEVPSTAINPVVTPVVAGVTGLKSAGSTGSLLGLNARNSLSGPATIGVGGKSSSTPTFSGTPQGLSLGFGLRKPASQANLLVPLQPSLGSTSPATASTLTTAHLGVPSRAPSLSSGATLKPLGVAVASPNNAVTGGVSVGSASAPLGDILKGQAKGGSLSARSLTTPASTVTGATAVGGLGVKSGLPALSKSKSGSTTGNVIKFV